MSDIETTTPTRLVTGVASGKRIRRDRSYTVAEAAELCGVTHYAVARWVRLGYVAAERKQLDDSKRTVQHVAGADLADFLKSRKAAAKSATKASSKA